MENRPVIGAELAEAFDEVMERGRIALFSAPCGFGKSVVSRALLRRRRVRELSADGEDFALPENDGTWDVLVLDQLQELPEEARDDLCQLLRTAVDRRFVLLSRGQLPGWLTPFRFSGLMQVFTAEDLALTYQCTSATALRIAIAPREAAAAVVVDVRRTSIYNASTVETQTLNGSTIAARTVLDEIVYSNSQETHSMKLRQQDPVTKLWSLCEISTFISAAGARTSIRIQWNEYDVRYEAPTV